MYEYENNPLYQKGEEVLIETGAVPKALHHWRNIDPIVGPELDRMLGEFCFGDVWAREGLDYKTKRIITITTIAVLGRPTLLRTHIKGALDQGFTREELLSVFIHMIPYAGFPIVLSCIEVDVEVFRTIDNP